MLTRKKGDGGGGSRYSTTPPTKRGVDMGYPGVRIYIHPILFVASGSRKNAENAFSPLRSRRHSKLGEECENPAAFRGSEV